MRAKRIKRRPLTIHSSLYIVHTSLTESYNNTVFNGVNCDYHEEKQYNIFTV
jgi:hypothetical protein